MERERDAQEKLLRAVRTAHDRRRLGQGRAGAQDLAQALLLGQKPETLGDARGVGREDDRALEEGVEHQLQLDEPIVMAQSLHDEGRQCELGIRLVSRRQDP